MQKITLKIGLETDDDYSLRNNELYHMVYDDAGGYFHNFVFEDNTEPQPWEEPYTSSREPAYRALDLLEKMLCDIHVASGHYYIMDDIFHMFDDAIHAIYRREAQFESSVSGNYEGTFIEVYCEENCNCAE